MAGHELGIRETPSGLDVPLHVQPRARRTELAGWHNGALKLKVQAPPVDNAANQSIVHFFSQLLDIPKSRMAITSGARSRSKILRIQGISRAQFLSQIRPQITQNNSCN
jgi:uncharacterized protein (TIGR00251 family)